MFDCFSEAGPAVVVPGQRLANADNALAGTGAFVRDGMIFASLVGTTAGQGNIVPEVGSVVTAKVTSINKRFAKADILLVDSKATKITFRGMIRIQDVRAVDKDKVELFKSFRPGDVVMARIISLGDARSYYLSTAENTLGVIWAQSESGGKLQPVAWDTMQCTTTGAKEARKVAKPAGL
eukprot:gene5811-16939_t